MLAFFSCREQTLKLRHSFTLTTAFF